MARHHYVIRIIAGTLLGVSCAAAPAGSFGLDLPPNPVSDHVTIARSLFGDQREGSLTLDGPGCIKRIWIALNRGPNSGRELPPQSPGPTRLQNRKIILRIYFDGADTPNVEAPIGDFFGMMHGIDQYDLNTRFLSAKDHAGYESYFEMPFAKSARFEISKGPGFGNAFHMQIDWHRYPGQEMKEKRRFSAQWRREMPAPRYGQDYMILDADGPGQLIGFFYGVRLLDDTDRWSHGGAENIYLDGLGENPAYLRGLGGEDTFGTSYGGVLHRPETHLHTGMPYYFAEDTGEARSAQRVVGYRFYVEDTIQFRNSIRFHFGSMANDICSMIYWYQEGVPRRFVALPDWNRMLPGTEIAGSEIDLPMPDHGSWGLSPARENEGGAAIRHAQAASGAVLETAVGWTEQATYHGFVDFNHVNRPKTRGAGSHFSGKAAEAVTELETSAATTARVRIAWDDHLVLRVNEGAPIDFGTNTFFRQRTVEVPLRKGRNRISVVLSNETGTNWGGWTFAFRATTAEGRVLVPRFSER